MQVLALPLPWLSFPDDQSCILHVSEARQPLSAQRLRLPDPVGSGWKCPLSNTRVASANPEVKMPWAVGPKVLGSLPLPPSLCFSHSGLPEVQNKGQQGACHSFFQSLHWQVRGGGGAEPWGGAMLCPGQGQDRFTEPPHVTSTFRVLFSAICSHPTGAPPLYPLHLGQGNIPWASQLASGRAGHCEAVCPSTTASTAPRDHQERSPCHYLSTLMTSVGFKALAIPPPGASRGRKCPV